MLFASSQSTISTKSSSMLSCTGEGWGDDGGGGGVAEGMRAWRIWAGWAPALGGTPAAAVGALSDLGSPPLFEY